MTIKEQNNSHHSSLLIGPNGFLKNPVYCIFFLRSKDFGCFVFILIEQRLFEICQHFPLNLVSLWLSVSKERMFLLPLLSVELNLCFFALLCVKLWFFGFDTTRFHNYFLVFRFGQFFTFFLVLSHYDTDGSQNK